MSDLEKAKLLLRILSSQKIELNGAREAFLFTESYQWLIDLAKKLEKEANGDDK